MADNTLVSGINEWLADQALSEPDIVGMFEGLCHRLHAIGIPLARARLNWPTLHPLFQAETILWTRSGGTQFEQFRHQEIQSKAWLESPMRHMILHDITVLRRNLDGPNMLTDFPIMEEVAELGMTDYLVISTNLYHDNKTTKHGGLRRSIFVTWCADRKGGFSNKEIESLQKIQRRFAVACKTVIQSRISHNIVETYLGKLAGDSVLNGSIKRGDGDQINAVVWYSDLRNSTSLADTMEGSEYLQLLNAYFECTAGPIMEAGGEVLDFIGDAVLAIFPYEDEDEKNHAVCAATSALNASIKAHDQTTKERKKAGLATFRFGIGLNVGTLMFGNIGVAQRLTFSVIGPTVNEVARIETMTKITGKRILATKDVAAFEPSSWIALGAHTLQGVSQKVELFTLVEEADSARAVPIQREKPKSDRVSADLN